MVWSGLGPSAGDKRRQDLPLRNSLQPLLDGMGQGELATNTKLQHSDLKISCSNRSLFNSLLRIQNHNNLLLNETLEITDFCVHYFIDEPADRSSGDSSRGTQQLSSRGWRRPLSCLPLLAQACPMAPWPFACSYLATGPSTHSHGHCPDISPSRAISSNSHATRACAHNRLGNSTDTQSMEPVVKGSGLCFPNHWPSGHTLGRGLCSSAYVRTGMHE